MRFVAFTLALAVLAAGPACAFEVKIAQGALEGDTTDGIASFKNIPYAAAPVDALRWRAPQAAPGWQGTRDATSFGPICPQNQRVSFFNPKLPMSEDCLSLNVWTPKAETGAKLPVMVWIYGGGFLTGSSALPLYDATDLAKHGVVVVTLNYRLGVLGFFNHPALASEHLDEAGGNFGLLDQIAALKWVQRNIASFGGDPSNVTIFGESAGGVSVNDLIASPPARGLFHRAISESGLGLPPTTSAAEAEKDSADFAAKLKVTGSDADTLAKLRKLKVADILKQQGDLKTEGHVQPFIDGKVIPDDVSVLFAKGEIAKVDYMAGSNSNEASLAPNLGMDPVQGLSKFGDQLPKVRAIYEAGGPLTDAEFGRQTFNDALFASGAQDFAAYEVKAGGTGRVYYFGYVADTFKGKVLGVNHGGELVFVFGLRGLGILASRATEKDRAMIAMTQDYWTNFAKTGDPNGTGLPAWPAFTPASRRTLVIDDETKAIADFRRPQIGVMEAGWALRTGLTAP